MEILLIAGFALLFPRGIVMPDMFCAGLYSVDDYEYSLFDESNEDDEITIEA